MRLQKLILIDGLYNDNEDSKYSNKVFKDNIFSILQDSSINVNKFFSYIMKYSRSKFESQHTRFSKVIQHWIEDSIEYEKNNENFNKF